MTDTLPVAEYLRMSTEHQQYSLDNQQARIAAYAERLGFTVVKTYSDEAKSGVGLKRRNGLRQLLQDVMNRDAGYRAILVYDVSRWGRFQDADEAAHYEFVCKQAGVPVHYCAEPFVNDGGIQNTLMKALKRTMAGEYSRELGVKVLAGLKRLATLGYKQGGVPGYGLRRMLVSADGRPKQILAPGERKSIATERVVLVPGPDDEVRVVRRIYQMLLNEGMSVYAIAGELNREGVPYGKSRWTHHSVQQILSHPKYSGCNVFGRTTQKLGTPSVQVPEKEWVRTPGAFVPVVDEEWGQEARRLLSSRTGNKSDDELLEALRQLLAKTGRLSLQLIQKSAETPSPSTYRKRFGSLRRSYELIGYGLPDQFAPIDLRRRTQALRDELMALIAEMFPDEVKIVRHSGRWRSRLKLKNGPMVSVLIVRCVHVWKQTVRWQIDPVRRECRLVTLLARLDEANHSLLDFHILPGMDRKRRFRISRSDEWLDRGWPLKDVSAFCELVSRVNTSKTDGSVCNRSRAKHAI